MKRLCLFLSGSSSFVDREIPLKHTISILAKNKIEVNDNEAGIILDFLSLVARNGNQQKIHKKQVVLKEKSTCKNRTVSQCTITNWLSCSFAIKKRNDPDEAVSLSEPYFPNLEPIR